MNTTSQALPSTNTSAQRNVRLIGGLILLAPAALIGLGGLAGPTLATVILSLQKTSLSSAAAQFVGAQNYSLLLNDKTFGAALTYTLGLVIVRLLVVAIVPVLMALAVNRFGRAVRWPMRLLFTVPLAMFAPAAIGVVWLESLSSGLGFFKDIGWLTSPDRARLALTFIDGLYVYGLACAAGTVIYLAALRRPEGSAAPSKRPLVAAWITSLLAVVALTLQSFALSYVLTGGGPANSTTTLALYQYSVVFRFLRFGTGAAVATLMLAVLAVLGLGAGLIVVLAGLKLELGPWRDHQEHSQPRHQGNGAIVLLGVALLVSVAVGVAGTWPPLANILVSFQNDQAYTKAFQTLPLATAFTNTLVPPLLIVLLQLPVAYLAALGIGAVRPLGRWSEVLLLPISPWLFVTAVPLSIVAFQNVQKMHGLNTLVGLIPPLPLSVPMVFALTLFFKGQVTHWQNARLKGQSAAAATWSQLIWPSLPLVCLLAAVALLVGLQDLYWPLLISSTPSGMPFSVALIRQLHLTTDWPLVAASITTFELPLFLWFFVALGLLQCLYLDRLILTDGRTE
jgi:ABC-type sugar transport system permease subunit